MSENQMDEMNSVFAGSSGLLALRPSAEISYYPIGKNVICTTDYRPRARTRFEIVLDATDGFIPLWEKGMVLRWRFNEASLERFQQPEPIKAKVETLLQLAISHWQDAAPIRFDKNSDNSDFEIVVEPRPNCSPQGCTLARAFFPDAGRHQLIIFPTMFDQDETEQIETLAHEVGHMFGLRHFFAPEFETRWPSVIFGEHNKFSIMNYGEESRLTDADRNDLKALYAAVWDGRLTEINGTPIKTIKPFHYSFQS